MAALISRGGAVAASGLDGTVVFLDRAQGDPRYLEGPHPLDTGRAPPRVNGLYANQKNQLNSGIPGFVRLCWTGDGRYVAGVSPSGFAIAWGIDSPERREIYRANAPLTAIASSPGKGDTLLIGDAEGNVHLGTINTNSHSWQSCKLDGGAIADIVALDGARWLVGQTNGQVVIIDRTVIEGTGIPIKGPKLEGPLWDLDVATTAETTLIAVATGDEQARVYSVESDGRFVPHLFRYIEEDDYFHGSRIQSVAFSDNGKLLATGNAEGWLAVFDLASAHPVVVAHDQAAPILGNTSVQFLQTVWARSLPGLAFGKTSDGSEVLYTGGLDSSVKRWRLSRGDGVTELALTRGVQICFDTSDPKATHLLWAYDEEGTLLLVDSVTGRELDRESISKALKAPSPDPNAPIQTARSGRALAISSDGLVATLCEPSTVKFWRRRGDEIVEVRHPIDRDAMLAGIGLSSDGSLLASFEVKHIFTGLSHDGWPRPDHVLKQRLIIREIATGHQWGGLELRDQPAVDDRNPAFGTVVFHPTASRLIALGTRQSPHVLSFDRGGRKLETVQDQDLGAGWGAVRAAWKSGVPDFVVAGDTRGSVKFSNGFSSRLPSLEQLIAGLTFSPDGRRLAIAGRKGRIALADVSDTSRGALGATLVFDDNRAGVVTELQFDPSGERLALVCSDGRVRIHESRRRPKIPEPASESGWPVRINRDVTEYGDLRISAPSITVDPRGDVFMLIATQIDEPEPPGAKGTSKQQRTKHVRVTLLRFDGEGRLEQNQVDEFPSDDTQGSCSTTLRFEGETLIVGYARPPSGDKANNRELVQERWTLGPGGPRRLLGPARVLAGDNWGFDAHWLPWAKGLWALSHHSLNGYYHYVSIPELNTPPVRVGYQGDGRFQQAVYDSQGCWHLVMAPHRSNGDPSPLVYVKYRPTGNPRNPVETLIRAPIDNSPDSHRPDFGLATLPDDRAVVLMCRPHPISDRELVLKTMNDNGKWQTEQVLDWQPIVFSNLLCESDGTLRFLYIQTEGVPRPRLMLATRRSGRWQVEIVGDFQAPGRLKFESAWLADDPRGGLVAVVKGGYLTKDGIEKHVLLWVFRSR